MKIFMGSQPLCIPSNGFCISFSSTIGYYLTPLGIIIMIIINVNQNSKKKPFQKINKTTKKHQQLKKE